MTVVIDRKVPTHRVSAELSHETESTVVRFAGDSGDGIQLAGGQFARAASGSGAWIMTLPEYPAEIRAPVGTTFGVSAYQIQFGTGEVLTPGDEADMLVAFNPAAFVTNLSFVKSGGTVIIDEGTFNKRGFSKAKLDDDPTLKFGDHDVRIIRVNISKRTLEAVESFGIGRKDSMRARNFWALGLALWLNDQPISACEEWIAKRFSSEETIRNANTAALKTGHSYGETMELALPHTAPRLKQSNRPDKVSMISGTDAMSLGIVAIGALSKRPVIYCSYPITPASALLHALAHMPEGVKTFQAEDEISAISAAIGASYAGAVSISASSGPGLALKTEGLGLAVAAELPLIVIDVQRAGPSTGMPTKPEQSDLDMAIFGRHGEAPVAVVAPATCEDSFYIMMDAARIAFRAMTPVIVLSDAFLANAVSEWVAPSADQLEDIDSPQLGDSAARNDTTLARKWVSPGMAGFEHRVGGIEKDRESGNISYDPDNHEAMVTLRAEKLTRAAAHFDRPFLFDGPNDGEILVVGWGSTFGSIRQAVKDLRDDGTQISHLHLRQLWPLPKTLKETFNGFKHIVCAELNSGQLARILRSELLLNVVPITQINGRPFRISWLKKSINLVLFPEIT